MGRIEEKYRALVPSAPLSQDKIEASLKAIKGLPSASGVSDLVRELG